MRVRYTNAAIGDVEHIFSYIAERNPRAAMAVVDAIEATVARIGSFPSSAQATDAPGVRMSPAGRFPYVVFYTFADDEIRIIRVLHGAQMRPWEGQD